MNDELLALPVYGQEAGFRNVEQTLGDLGVRIQHAHTCWEARAALREPHSLRLILTATTLADGTWEDVRKLASVQGRAIPVIVVSRIVDIHLYLTILESGAADFIVPPFSAADLAYLVHTAIGKSRAAASA
jgi:DNA-binding NtrC family response regulator